MHLSLFVSVLYPIILLVLHGSLAPKTTDICTMESVHTIMCGMYLLSNLTVV